ncbi:MAG: hypothetical protein ACK4FL_00045 [Microgenomates group bacterium]
MENLLKNNNLIHSIDPQKEDEKISYTNFLGLVGGAIILGIIVGFGATKIQKLTKTETSTKTTQIQKIVGIADKKTFKDKAEGVLREGGIDGEGNFHLERVGGPSQNVYLTSSTVDLSQYIGKKVRVWGKTFKGEKAGWLMDVGLIELLQ